MQLDEYLQHDIFNSNNNNNNNNNINNNNNNNQIFARQLSEYRVQLYEYLQNRMRAIAPNLTTMVTK